MSSVSDSELKARHRAMWASGDYPSMVETFLLPLGPRLADACDIYAPINVLDVASGTGHAAIPAAQAAAEERACFEHFDPGDRRLTFHAMLHGAAFYQSAAGLLK